MDEIRNWASQWGNIASVAGVLLSLVGFVATIIVVCRSKAAAEQAREAAVRMRESLAQYDAVAELSAAVSIMDEIKRLHRQEAWPILPDRYAEFRRRVLAIKGSAAGLSEEQKQILQGSIESFRDLEHRVDRVLASGSTPPNPAKLNDVVSSHIDAVHAVLLTLQRTLEVMK